MLAWSLSGILILATATPVAGDRAALPAKPKLRIIDVAQRGGYRLPASSRLPVAIVIDELRIRTPAGAGPHDTRFDRPLPVSRPVIHDPQTDCLKTLLRDRMARRGGALDARVEWRLTGAGSDLGIGGGLKRVVDTLLHD